MFNYFRNFSSNATRFAAVKIVRLKDCIIFDCLKFFNFFTGSLIVISWTIFKLWHSILVWRYTFAWHICSWVFPWPWPWCKVTVAWQRKKSIQRWMISTTKQAISMLALNSVSKDLVFENIYMAGPSRFFHSWDFIFFTLLGTLDSVHNSAVVTVRSERLFHLESSLSAINTVRFIFKSITKPYGVPRGGGRGGEREREGGERGGGERER